MNNVPAGFLKSLLPEKNKYQRVAIFVTEKDETEPSTFDCEHCSDIFNGLSKLAYSAHQFNIHGITQLFVKYIDGRPFLERGDNNIVEVTKKRLYKEFNYMEIILTNEENERNGVSGQNRPVPPEDPFEGRNVSLEDFYNMLPQTTTTTTLPVPPTNPIADFFNNSQPQLEETNQQQQQQPQLEAGAENDNFLDLSVECLADILKRDTTTIAKNTENRDILITSTELFINKIKSEPESPQSLHEETENNFPATPILEEATADNLPTTPESHDTTTLDNKTKKKKKRNYKFEYGKVFGRRRQRKKRGESTTITTETAETSPASPTIPTSSTSTVPDDTENNLPPPPSTPTTPTPEEINQELQSIEAHISMEITAIEAGINEATDEINTPPPPTTNSPDKIKKKKINYKLQYGQVFGRRRQRKKKRSGESTTITTETTDDSQNQTTQESEESEENLKSSEEISQKSTSPSTPTSKSTDTHNYSNSPSSSTASNDKEDEEKSPGSPESPVSESEEDKTAIKTTKENKKKRKAHLIYGKVYGHRKIKRKKT